MRRRLLALAAAALALPVFAADAPLPARPIRLLVGYAPGSGADVVARLVAERLQDVFKQGVVVENKPGAGGTIAAREVVRAAPDGSTLLLGAMPEICIAPATNAKLGYDPQRELVPVSQIVATDLVLLVNPKRVPAGSVQDFVAWARTQSSLFFATPGQGTVAHFGASVFASTLKVKVEPVHFKTTGEAITGIVNGDIHAQFVPYAVALPQVRSGLLKALAATSPVRSSIFPDTPTFKEAGYPELRFDSWYGVLAPAGTPAALLDRLNAEIVKAALAPETRTKLETAGLRLTATPREDFARAIRDDSARWGQVVRESGFKAQD